MTKDELFNIRVEIEARGEKAEKYTVKMALYLEEELQKIRDRLKLLEQNKECCGTNK